MGCRTTCPHPLGGGGEATGVGGLQACGLLRRAEEAMEDPALIEMRDNVSARQEKPDFASGVLNGADDVLDVAAGLSGGRPALHGPGFGVGARHGIPAGFEGGRRP